jgi:hypothetical protein
LRQLLELKFGEVVGPELERIEAASEEQLLRWTPRVLTAETLADVLAG